MSDRQDRLEILQDHYGEHLWVFDSGVGDVARYVAIAQEGGWSRGDFHPERALFFSAETEQDAFEILADSFLDGQVMEAVYDLDTGERIELHVSTPIVSRSEDQGVMVNPLEDTVQS